MLGYPRGIKGYKLWCLEFGRAKLLISRDLTVQENIMPYKNNSENAKDMSNSEFMAKGFTTGNKENIEVIEEDSDTENEVENTVANLESLCLQGIDK